MNQIHFSFPKWDVISVHGPDAKDFLHRITSTNFKALQPGQSASGTMLTALGKMIFYFESVHDTVNDRYLLVVPDGFGVDAAAELEKLHFMEKLQIASVRKDMQFYRVLTSQQEKQQDALDLPTGAIRLELNQWIADKWPVSLKEANGFKPIQDVGVLLHTSTKPGWTFEESDFYRIASLSPAAGIELLNTTIPLEAGLTEAVHENKGCYPGQEVVERIRAIGQTARVLGRICGTGAKPEVGAAVLVDGAEVGTLTSVAAVPAELKARIDWVALAYIGRIAAKGKTSLDGVVNDTSVAIDLAQTGAKRA